MSEELPPIVDNLRFFGGAARTQEGRSAGEYMAGFTSFIRREPIGIAGLIAPWNYPLMMAIWKIGPALATGNCIVLKPSELTPLTALKMAELAEDLFPPGVFNVITGDGEPVGDTLVRHPDVGIVSLTGDVNTGKLIAKNASDTLKRVHLELGGKAPVIIFDDADISTAVEWVKIAGYFNAGQDCTAACRVLVGSAQYDNVLSELVPAVESIAMGDPFEDATEVGAVISKEQLERVEGFVERAQEAGGSVLTGGSAMERDGFFYKPTVVADVKQDAEIIQKRGLRSRRDRAAVRRRGAGALVGERRRLRPRVVRVDARRGTRDADGAPAAIRLRLGEHAHPAHAGDAARWVQAERARQGHVRVLPRGLHEHQARDDLAGVAVPDAERVIPRWRRDRSW